MTDASAPENPGVTPGTKPDARPDRPRVYPEVGAALLRARRECGMTQQQLADATGVSRITIQRIEQAHINPSFKTLEALAHGMGRTLTVSFDGKD